MPSWKKVIVSGSQAHLQGITASQVPTGTTENVLVITTTGEIKQVSQGTLTGQSIRAFSTASAGGAELIADSSNGNLTFASSSGQGLTISGNSGTDTITFGLSSIPNTSLANSTISGVSLGGTLNTLTLGAGLNGTSYNGSAAVVASVDSGSMLPYYSSSIFSRVSGDILINSAGAATIQANSVALGTDTTGDYVANLGTGTGVTITSNTGEGSQPTIAVDYGSTANTAVRGNTNITINGTANEIEITGTPAQALGGGPSYTIGLPNDVTVTNNLTVGGNLTVNGDTTILNVANVLVEDKFILLASGSISGSATHVDGGIIVQYTTGSGGSPTGSALFLNSKVDVTLGTGQSNQTFSARWGLNNSVGHTQTTLNPTDYLVSVTRSQAVPTAAPEFGGQLLGFGNMYIQNNGDIWFWSPDLADEEGNIVYAG